MRNAKNLELSAAFRFAKTRAFSLDGRPPSGAPHQFVQSSIMIKKGLEKHMRNLLIGFALSAALSLPAAAADVRNFTIVNGTGYEIEFIGVNPPDDDDFGENELSDGLANGKSVYIKFNNADHGCNWNIKVKWTGYSEEVLFKDFDLCSISKATLRYDRGTRKTTALVE